MTDFKRFIAKAWNDHADNAEAVAAQLDDAALALATEPGDVAELSRMAFHVHGAHLARWTEGIAWQQRVGAMRVTGSVDAAGQATVQRHITALSLAGRAGQAGDPRAGLDASDVIWATALAAGSLAPHDSTGAGELFHDALARFEAAGLPGTAACVRALAVTGNNLAAELEERPSRNDTERELMIQAAQTARRCWALAGGWMEIERAEYRLAKTWLKAGDAVRARLHAEACLALIKAHGDVPLERFSGLEVQLLAARALGETSTAQNSAETMRRVFAELSPDDQRWCRATLDKLAP